MPSIDRIRSRIDLTAAFAQALQSQVPHQGTEEVDKAVEYLLFPLVAEAHRRMDDDADLAGRTPGDVASDLTDRLFTGEWTVWFLHRQYGAYEEFHTLKIFPHVIPALRWALRLVGQQPGVIAFECPEDADKSSLQASGMATDGFVLTQIIGTPGPSLRLSLDEPPRVRNQI